MGTSNIFALNASSGNQVWNYSANGAGFLPLSLIGDALYFNSLNGAIIALNAANGTQLWSVNADSNGTITVFAVNDGVFYYYLGQTLYALDASSGNSLWNYKTSSVQSFLTVTNNTAFLDARNTVYALNIPQSQTVPEFSSAALILVVAAVVVATFGSIALAAKKLNRISSDSK